MAADGLRSVVRQQLGVPGDLRYSGYTAWRGIAPFPSSRALAGESPGRGQRFGLVPIAGDRVYWYATANVPEGQRESAGAAKSRLRGLFASWHDPIPAVIDATPDEAILRNDIYDRDPATSWGAGRVTLLGDAAHPMTPNLGQGACQAIEDAMVLASALGADADITAALRCYESARIPRTRAIVLASRRVGTAFQIESRIGCWLRDAALRLMPASATYRNLERIAGYERHLNGG